MDTTLLVLPVWLIGILAGLLLAGVLAFWFGLRGRRVDDHPICARCGFDLFGLPPDADRCSECGNHVAHAGAVRIGHRARNMRLLASGLIMLLVGLLGTALVGWGMARNADVTRLKPVWWLLSDARNGTPGVRAVALRELTSRLIAGQLSNTQINSVVERGLDVQANPKQPWATGWGDFIETAETVGNVSSEKWQRYARQALETGWIVDTRPQVRKGAPLPIRKKNASARVGQNQRLWIEYRITKLELDGVDCDKRHTGSGGGTGLGSSGTGASWSAMNADDPVLSKLDLGQHTVRLTVDVKVCDQRKPSQAGQYPAIWQGTITRNANFDLVDKATVNVVKDDSLRQAVEKAIKITRQEKQSGERLSLNIDVQNPPVGLAFQVFAKQGDSEWRIGAVNFAARTSSGWHVGGDAKGFQDGPFDVVLRPSLEAAEGHVEANEMWDGQVVVKNVPGKS